MNWIFGDIHGEVAMLEKLLSLVKEKDPDCILHFAGDYVDRGLQSKQVIDILMGLENAYFIRGNHDDIFDMVINGEAVTCNNGPNEAAKETIWFIQYGMVETLESYGVPKTLVLHDLIEAYEKDTGRMLHSDKMYPDADEDGEIANIMEKIRSYIPDSHKKWIRELPIVNRQKDFFVAHAYIPTSSSRPETEMKELIHETVWGRFTQSEIDNKKNWGLTGYFGHTPTKHYGKQGQPVVGNQCVLLDTGATFGDNLTAWCHETGEVIFVPNEKPAREYRD